MKRPKDPEIVLPNDVWSHVLCKLDFQSNLVCERTCRQLHSLLSQPGLWNNMPLTLEQLLGSDNELLYKDTLTSPAARCVTIQDF